MQVNSFPLFGGLAACLFIITGIVLLTGDATIYRNRQMGRETKASRRLGWANVVVGVCIVIGNWVYNRWLW
ncbi:MAG: hypothetical protein K6T78_08290 [Alicyclobacillus sp.]|nr:hypothetical protein [Alicyclobacillus sp.]